MFHCYEVVANVELDIEEIVDAIIREYDTTIEDVNMDLIAEYVDDHITYMKGRNGARGIEIVGDGPSITGFYDYYGKGSYTDIEEELDRIKRERGVEV